jgi:hypothetical protein
LGAYPIYGGMLNGWACSHATDLYGMGWSLWQYILKGKNKNNFKSFAFDVYYLRSLWAIIRYQYIYKECLILAKG